MDPTARMWITRFRNQHFFPNNQVIKIILLLGILPVFSYYQQSGPLDDPEYQTRIYNGRRYGYRDPDFLNDRERFRYPEDRRKYFVSTFLFLTTSCVQIRYMIC